MLNAARTENGLVTLPCGRVLAISGHPDTHPLGTYTPLGVEVYDPTGDRWYAVHPKAGETEIDVYMAPYLATVLPDGGIVTFRILRRVPGAPHDYFDDAMRLAFLR